MLSLLELEHPLSPALDIRAQLRLWTFGVQGLYLWPSMVPRTSYLDRNAFPAFLVLQFADVGSCDFSPFKILGPVPVITFLLCVSLYFLLVLFLFGILMHFLSIFHMFAMLLLLGYAGRFGPLYSPDTCTLLCSWDMAGLYLLMKGLGQCSGHSHPSQVHSWLHPNMDPQGASRARPGDSFSIWLSE